MKAAALAALICSAALTGTAQAADRIVALTLDGRPVDRAGGAAVWRHDHVFADAIDLTKTFDGFITLRRGGSATITIGANTGTFSPGSRQAKVNDAVVFLPAAPFMRNGDLFVPLDAFVTRIAAANVRLDAMRRRADIRVAPGRSR